MREYVFRQAEITDIVSGADELLSGEDGGDVVVVSGGPQSGRSTMLRHLAVELADQGWTVVRRQAEDGLLVPPSGDGVRQAGWAVQGLKIAGAATNLVAPAAGSIMALAGEVATALHMNAAEASPGVWQDPYLAMTELADVLERAAATAPVALVLDDADQLVPPQVWWDGLFGVTLPRLMENLPVLAVLGVDGSAAVRRSHAWTVLDERLFEHGIATETALSPLTPDDVVRALGDVEETLAAELVRFGRGRPGWVDDLLRRWRADGVVVQEAGWRFAADGYARARATQRNRVDALLQQALPDDHERAREVLRLASLEGPVFTAEAVASVLGEQPETLAGWIGGTLAATDPPLAEDAGDAAGLHRYRIVSPLLAGTLREATLSGTDGPVVAGRYAHALYRLYRDRPQFPSAWTISRLAAHARDEEITEAVWRRASRQESLAELAERGRQIAERLTDEVGNEERVWLTGQLNALVARLLDEGWQVDRTLLLAQSAESSARSLDRPTHGDDGRSRSELLVEALGNLGGAQFGSTDLVRAIATLDEAAVLSARTPAHGRTARLHMEAATARMERRGPDSVAGALEHANAAVDFARRIPGGSVGATMRVQALATASLAHTEARDVSNAGATAREAAVELEQLAARMPSGYRQMCVQVLAATNFLCIALDDDSEIEFAERRLACTAGEDRRSVALSNLGVALRRRGRIEDAVESFCRALRVAQGLHGVRQEAIVLAGLAQCADDGGTAAGPRLLAVAQQLWEDAVTYAVQPATSTPDEDLTTRMLSLDADERRELADAYRADRGATLLRETFGVDVDAVDMEIARQRPPTRDDLVDHARAVAQWCRSRFASTGPDDTTPPQPAS